MTTAWTAAAVQGIGKQMLPAARVITAVDVVPLLADLWLWDLWPVQTPDGAVAAIEGGELWLALSAPITPDPIDRHGRARLRLLHKVGGAWRDLGNALPNGHSPGSREWSGSTILDGDTLTLFFTAAGRRGEATLSYEQRLFETRATLHPGPRLGDWTAPRQCVASDGVIYDPACESEGAVGTIKAFRDPAWFRDPADGQAYLLFTASLAGSPHACNGAIGIARQSATGWELLPPLVHADGVNNELERPHIVIIAGRYHLFWSTQGSVFASGLVAPTGLYGMVADSLFGPWMPINGTGLVLANPAHAPDQAYSWLVLDPRRVTSFIDRFEGGFGGIPAPDQPLPG